MSSKLTIEPDYKIQEFFAPDKMEVYFRVISMGQNPCIIREFDTLDAAKYCVRMMRKYKQPIYHYVED